MGKGSGRRPLLTSNEQLEKNWDLIFGKQKTIDPLPKETPHKILRQSRIDTVGQNGNDGLHYELDDGQLTDEQYAKIKEYEYELNKASGEVEKRFLDGINKPNEEQFNGRQESNTVNISKTPEGTVPTSSDSGKVE
ncbi:hypothetical protein EB001_16050 [bacterium]|nr:hypothetical protein [bacterium]